MILGSIDLSCMESRLVNRGLDFTIKKKKWILLIGLIGFSSYGVYKVYNMPSIARRRRRVMKLFESLVAMAEMVSDSAETVTVISRELKEFLMSDSDEIPNSVKQLSKIARSEEFSESVIRVCQAMTVGIQRGCYCSVESNRNEIQEEGDNSSFTERVMDKVMSTAGTGFVSVIAGSFARNLVLGFYASNDGSDENLKKSSSSQLPSWMNLVLDDKCRVVVADCIKTFVSTAVGVYLDKTMDVNFYDEMFSGLTNPKHQNQVSDMLVSLCNGAVETLVKTSHHVLTDSKRESSDSSHVSSLEKKGQKEIPGNIDSGWVSSVSSTLAVPSNRKFVLDVTGRVTFETVKSVIEFSLWKVSQGLNVVRDEVVEKGFQVMRYIGAKSYVILTICLALFLHILGSSRVLLPA